MDDKVKTPTEETVIEEPGNEEFASNEDLNLSQELTEESTSIQKKKSGKKKIVIIAIILVLVALLILRVVQGKDGQVEVESSLVNVKTSVAELTSIHTTSPITGRVQPVEEVTIIPLASGEITGVYVNLGDYVSKGSTILDIDKTQMSTTLNQAKQGLDTAKSAFDRMSVLYDEGAISLQDYENAKTQYITAQESYTSASDAYNNCTVTAPISGYITSLSAKTGGVASSAAPAATIADVSVLEISTTVSEYLISEIKVGDPVEIYIATLGDTPFSGTIKALSPAPATGSLTYPATITVNDDSGKVMAGMFAEVQVIADEKDKVLCVPSDAVIMKNGESIVVALEKDLPVFKKVTTGIESGEYTEITSGLSEGDIVVISGQQYVTEGSPVSIIKDKAPSKDKKDKQ